MKRKKHSWDLVVFVVCLLVGFLTILPFVSYLKKECFLVGADAVKGIDGDTKGSYAPRVAAVVKGGLLLGDAALFEHRNDWFNEFEKVPPLIGGMVVRLVGDFDLAYLLLVCFFASFSAFAWYLFISILTSNRVFSLFASVLMNLLGIWAYPILLFLKNSVEIGVIWRLAHFVWYFGWYSHRFYHVLFSLPFMLLFLREGFLVYKKKKPQKIRYLWLGLLLGLFAYLYSYYFVFAIVFLGFLGFWELLENPGNQKKILGILASILLGLIIGFPFLLAVKKLGSITNLSFGDDFQLLKLGAYLGRWSFNNFLSMRRLLMFGLLLMSIIGLERVFGVKKSVFRLVSLRFLMVAILACEVASNSNVITGYGVQLYHFRSFVLPTVLFPFFLLMIYFSLKRMQKKWWVIGLTAVLLFTLVQQTVQFMENDLLSKSCDRESYQVIEFLNTVPKNSVLLVFGLRTNVLTYTDHYVYLPYSYISTAAYEELRNRLIVTLKFQGVSAKDMGQYVYYHPLLEGLGSFHSVYIYSFRYDRDRQPPEYFKSLRDFEFDSTEFVTLVPDEIITEIRKELEKPVDEIPHYKLDYVVIAESDQEYDFSIFKSYDLVYKNNAYQVYKVYF